MDASKLSPVVEVSVEMYVGKTFQVKCSPEQLAALVEKEEIPNERLLRRALLAEIGVALCDPKSTEDDLLFDKPLWNFHAVAETNGKKPYKVQIL